MQPGTIFGIEAERCQWTEEKLTNKDNHYKLYVAVIMTVLKKVQ